MVLALVTGASGFVGPALCKRLRGEGWRVRAVVRRPAEGPWDESILVDLGREPVPLGTLAGVDCVFHLAGKAHTLAEGPEADEEYRISNVQSTLDLLAVAQAQSVCRFVYFSSVKAMDTSGDSGRAGGAELVPDSPYGRSKLAAERVVLGSGAVPHPVVVRPALVYGPNPKGHLELMIRAVRAGWFPPLPDLANGRSMVHRDDLVEAALLCASDPRAISKAYVVTDGTPYSTRQIYEYILEALGRKPPSWTLPVSVLRAGARLGDVLGRVRGRRFPFDSELLEKLVGSACYDGEAIRRELGFVPTRDLRGSMAEMVATTPARRPARHRRRP
jgi:UDP-glucose 4-epimerase